VRWAWKIRILTRIDVDLKMRLWKQAEEEAIKVFSNNLRDLLLAAPAGPRPTIGLDPGLRTGVKVAVLDQTGKQVATDTIYPHAPQNKWDRSIATLADLAKKHQIELISIGNGTASRETDKLAAELIKNHPELKLQKIMVSEAGASVYSASELAARELPGMDVSLRGAVSIARRLQDPLAELVKIDPKSIGVGQYQHDVNQTELARALDAVVEDCVNAVGVDANTASVALLNRVAGLNNTLAKNIVDYRDEHGAFLNRSQLKQIPRLGDKTFEQCAGFLRILDGDNPLDASAVHPEAYPVVERILKKANQDIKTIIGDGVFLRKLDPNEFTDEKFGLPTVKDILAELEKPGRDPRPEFRTAAFQDGIETMDDLEPGMILEGAISNVTNFGAFVDIGVHQDGLVHISAMANTFVSDPRAIVKAGDVVKVKILHVDLKRKRIALSMRLDDPIGEPGGAKSKPKQDNRQKPSQAKPKTRPKTAMAEALQRAMKEN
ncbi:S1 RNA-binding domain-containing protein, partial [bacterium]|nr:S1 RNA-binding domain-containing protein [bacterium]